MNRSLIGFAVLVIAVLVGFNNTSEWHHFDLIVSPTFTAALVFFGLYYTYKSALTKTTVTRSALFTMPKAEVHRSPYAPRYNYVKEPSAYEPVHFAASWVVGVFDKLPCSPTNKRWVASVVILVAAQYLNGVASAAAGHLTPNMSACAGSLSAGRLPDLIHNLWFVEIAIGQLGPIWTRRLPDILVVTNMAAAVFTVAVHPRSGVLLRRIFVILAYLFFLRSVCVVSTSLPDMSDHCQSQFDDMQPGGRGYYKTQPMLYHGTPFGDDFVWSGRILWRAAKLVFEGAGALHDTCGDLIFSAHTVFLWMAYMIVRDFSAYPALVLFVSTTKYLGAFFILLTRFHYTIDVVLAAYLSYRAWISYHRCATIEDVRRESHVGVLMDWLERIPDPLTGNTIDGSVVGAEHYTPADE